MSSHQIGALALAWALLIGLPSNAWAAQQPGAASDAIVARRGGIDLTVQDIDIKIRSMPKELQAGYLGESDRTARMIDSMLLTKQLAEQAEKLGLHESEEFRQDMRLLQMELLARYIVDKQVDEAPSPNVEALAYERYLANPKAHTPPPRIDISHILISTEGRAEADALAAAEEAYAKAKAGEDFDTIAREYGSDKQAASALKSIDLSRMDPHFAKAVGQLGDPGDIVGPTRSTFGYHIIRLDNYQSFPTLPFESVKAQLEAELLAQFKAKVKADFLARFSQMDVELDDALVQSLRTRYLPALDSDPSPEIDGAKGRVQ